MSLDIDWDATTGGEDGLALSDMIRKFVHDRFQQIPLPRFLKAVEVHGFDFGRVSPEVEIKDICDPLDDFYEDESEEEQEQEDEDGAHDGGTEQTGPAGMPSGVRIDTDARISQSSRATTQAATSAIQTGHVRAPPDYVHVDPSRQHIQSTAQPHQQASSQNSNAISRDSVRLMPGLLTSTSTPGIPGGTSNLSYFHLPLSAGLSAGLSGTTTPLAAVAGAHFAHNWTEASSRIDQGQDNGLTHRDNWRTAASVSSLTPPSTAGSSSRPNSQHQSGGPDLVNFQSVSKSSRAEIPDATLGRAGHLCDSHAEPAQGRERYRSSMRERMPEDLQVVAHVTYHGDVKLSLTAEILLDYPTESFVGIPLQLTITGLSFDGVAILAYIQRRAHFCFLSPEDAEAFSTTDDGEDTDIHELNAEAAQLRGNSRRSSKVGGLLEEIHVESEIGERGSGKQVLKNVGKVEKFILDQVRRLFEDECVYPSFWTFLV